MYSHCIFTKEYETAGAEINSILMKLKTLHLNIYLNYKELKLVTMEGIIQWGYYIPFWSSVAGGVVNLMTVFSNSQCCVT